MKKAILLSCLPLIFVLGIMFVVILAISGDGSGSGNPDVIVTQNLSDEVLAHKPMLEKYAKEYGVQDYVGYLLAIMQVESGGRLEDVMQSSESMGLPPNTLKKEESIRRACEYFKELLTTMEKLDCDMDSVIQSYNYGGGYMYYVAKNGNKHTFALAMEFSKNQCNGQKTSYYNAVAAPMGSWRYVYGNMYYVQLVQQYLGATFIWTSTDSHAITSVYGNRVHPITGRNDNHSGIDIGASFGTDILAIAAGTVVLAEYHSSYGNYVIVEHANGYKSLYAHQSQMKVRVGDTVQQGATIGLVGSTGNSTGAHIHLEIWKDGERTDPLSYYPETMYTYV